MTKKELKERVGLRIRRQRRLRDYTQKYISKQMKIASSTISFWETGERIPTLENLYNLEKLIGPLWPLE